MTPSGIFRRDCVLQVLLYMLLESIPQLQRAYADLGNSIVIPGMLLMPAGMFWYGWSAQYHYHWIVVDIGTAVFTMGSFIVSPPIFSHILHLSIFKDSDRRTLS